jgi:hypothetical protein
VIDDAASISVPGIPYNGNGSKICAFATLQQANAWQQQLYAYLPHMVHLGITTDQQQLTIPSINCCCATD